MQQELGTRLSPKALFNPNGDTDVRARRLTQGAQETAADTAVTVDGNANGMAGDHAGSGKQKGPCGP